MPGKYASSPYPPHTHIFSNLPPIQPPPSLHSSFYLGHSQSPWGLLITTDGSRTPVYHLPPNWCPTPPAPHEATCCCFCPLTPDGFPSLTTLWDSQTHKRMSGSLAPPHL